VAKIGTYAFLHCKGPIYCEAPSKPSGWNSDWSAGYTGEIIWGWGAPPADTKAPTLSKASATRASATTAKVSFTSSEAGSYYRAVLTKGAKAPAINTTGAGSALKAGSQSLTVGGLVSTKAYDIYLIGKDAAGNVSTKLKVSVSAWKAGFTGWKKTGSQWYYYKAGTKQKNTALSIQGKVYSFSATGAMITGWAKIKGVKRYHDSEGIAVKGWKQIGKNWYYFKTKGAGMVTGAQKISGAWYVFAGGNSGRMLTGWQKVGKSWYYLRGGSDGRAYRGWVQSGSNWYYFNPKTAKMATGWQKISGRYYYLSGANDGHMVTGTKTIKGVKYRFNASGALVAPKAPKK
jgi:glucan-binding YG repeat protein